ncbi:MAG: dTDP-4-amino-4,6-dideoxygalactose transaminase [Planctomycetota bacterium]
MNPERKGPIVPFNIPALTGRESEYVRQVFDLGKFSGNREFTRRCTSWFEKRLGTERALVTSSGTHALEMSALLADIRPDDEVITASFGFPSTANAFALRGARLVFIDVRADTMNLDEALLEEAVTERTRAIVVTHYAGVACEMDSINRIASEHGVTVVEDAAHAILATYRDRPCGTLGRFGCLSFHETKNIHCGEGGAILINEAGDVGRAEIVQEKGTDRARFYRGQVDKYSWVDLGSSYILSELGAAFLLAQLEQAEAIMADRMNSWNRYQRELRPLADEGRIALPVVPETCSHNAHCFYLKARDLAERDALMTYLTERGVGAVFHYVPLHSAAAGRRYGRFQGEDVVTTRDSERLLRMPLFFGLRPEQIDRVVELITAFYRRG